MEKERLMIKLTKNNKVFDYTPNNIHPINSTHYDQETRLYEIWDDKYFVIHQHSPWIDDKILNDKKIDIARSKCRIVCINSNQKINAIPDLILKKFLEEV